MAGEAIASSVPLRLNTQAGMPEGLRVERFGLARGFWFEGLGRASTDAERAEVARAVAEWADADSIAAHIGYGIDLFCTNDYKKGRWNAFDSR